MAIPNMLEPDYGKARLLEISVGRRFWQAKSPAGEDADIFYVRVVEPLRELHRQGIVEMLEEITTSGDETPIAVEIVGQIDLAKAETP